MRKCSEVWILLQGLFESEGWGSLEQDSGSYKEGFVRFCKSLLMDVPGDMSKYRYSSRAAVWAWCCGSTTAAVWCISKDD